MKSDSKKMAQYMRNIAKLQKRSIEHQYEIDLNNAKGRMSPEDFHRQSVKNIKKELKARKSEFKKIEDSIHEQIEELNRAYEEFSEDNRIEKTREAWEHMTEDEKTKAWEHMTEDEKNELFDFNPRY